MNLLKWELDLNLKFLRIYLLFFPLFVEIILEFSKQEFSIFGNCSAHQTKLHINELFIQLNVIQTLEFLFDDIFSLLLRWWWSFRRRRRSFRRWRRPLRRRRSNGWRRGSQNGRRGCVFFFKLQILVFVV